MKQKIIDAIKLILIFGLSVALITTLYIYEGKNNITNNDIEVKQDTFNTYE